MIHTSGVKVELISQISGRHRATFYMPSRKSLSSWRVSLHLSVPVDRREFPQTKVSLAFFVLIFYSRSFFQSLNV